MEPNNNTQNGMNRPRQVMTPGGVPMGGGAVAVSGAGAPRPMRAPGYANVPSEVTGGLGSDTGVPVEKPKKKSHAMLFGMIFLAILAAGGIGFGVWAMLDGNAKVAKKDERISELNSQLSEVAQQEMKEDITVTESDETVTESVSDVGVSMDAADYIYVGEWGLKIKIPDNLTITGYTYSMLPGYTSVKITGNTKSGQYLPGFADMSGQSPWLGTVSRYPKGTEMSPMSTPAFVFSDEQYDYYYSHPQMVISTDESEKQWEVESTEVIQQMLSNKENYSKF